MKLRIFVIYILSITFLFSGCGPTLDIEITTEVTTEQATETETLTTEQLVETPLFEDVFMKLYDKISISSFASVEEFVSKLDYESDIIKPSKTTLGDIYIYNYDCNESIYLLFDSYDTNVTTLKLISYGYFDKYIIVRYDVFTKSIEYSTETENGSTKIVDNLDDLKTFIFEN